MQIRYIKIRTKDSKWLGQSQKLMKFIFINEKTKLKPIN